MAESMHEKMMRQHGGKGGVMKPGHSTPNMKKASFEIALKDKKQIAEGTLEFTFEKPKEFKFRAGQHIRMTLIDPPETDEKGDSRFLSIASTPQDSDLTIAIRVSDSAFKRMLAQIPIGGKVLIQVLLGVPHGAFALHDDSAKPAVFVVGGIGIVPAYSMIKDATEKELPHKLYLFYSSRRPEDAPYLAELEKLAGQNPNFTLVATMTEADKSSRKWNGENSIINSVMLKKYIPDFRAPIYYVSGLPEMVSAMKTLLKDLGVREDNIHAEEFTGFSLNELPGVTEHRGKNHLLIALVVLAILAFVIVHALGATSVFHGGFGSFSLNNPVSYLAIGFTIIVILVKLKLFSMGYRHGKNK